MAEMDSSDCVAGTGALQVWCDGQKNVVNGFNVYYPMLQTADKVAQLNILQATCIMLYGCIVLQDIAVGEGQCDVALPRVSSFWQGQQAFNRI